MALHTSRRDTITYRRTGPVRCSAFQSRQANIKASLCTVFPLWTTTPTDYTYNRSVTTKVTQRSLIRKSSSANRSRSKLPGLRTADSQTKANTAHSNHQFCNCHKTVSGMSTSSEQKEELRSLSSIRTTKTSEPQAFSVNVQSVSYGPCARFKR